MVEQDTIKLLRECDAGIKMGISALDEVTEYAHSTDMRNYLRESTEENEKLRHMVEDMKIINRAKFLLISCLNMSETQAHRYLEKQAMDLRISKLQVAKQVIQTYEN